LSGILQFDSTKLKVLIDKTGIELAWKSILVTRIRNLNRCVYILKEPQFLGVQPLDDDLIADFTIGEVAVLYEFSVAYVDPKSRKDNGQYFTPDDVAKFMVGQIRKRYFEPNGTWLDPCSGIGNLSWHLVASQENPEVFLSECMILSDRDPLALLIARTIFTLDFQSQNSRLFKTLAPKFVCIDFLSNANNSEMFGDTYSGLEHIPKHDYVIVNPPYLATKRDPRFETKNAGDLYAYFLENIIKTSKGFISITPQSFTNAAKFKSLRKLILGFGYLRIFCFDNVPANIFRGIKFGSTNTNTSNSTRAAILVASNKGKSHKITPLIRWKSEQRAELFDRAGSFLAEAHLKEQFFPKVHPDLLPLYKEVSKPNYLKLADLTSSRGEFRLFVPSSPRYFIPGLKTSVSRTSMHVLRFPTVESMNLCYLLINSSFTYWWWRVRDGGMSLSLETLLNTPVPENLAISYKLVSKLEKSEFTNKVFKKNAGVEQENVKHDQALLEEINLSIFDKETATLLLSLHGNSELSNRLQSNQSLKSR
jgi:hypothetical protein